jgi:hypothetical protein
MMPTMENYKCSNSICDKNDPDCSCFALGKQSHLSMSVAGAIGLATIYENGNTTFDDSAQH